MKKAHFLLIAAALWLANVGIYAQVVECQEPTATSAADYYLSHPYYFQCTSLQDTLAHSENVKCNADGLIKLTGDGWSDYHWDGTSSAIFDNINLTDAGNYLLSVTYRNSGTVSLVVNDASEDVVLDGTSPLLKQVALNAGMNTIKLSKKADWPNFYKIELQKVVVEETTTITFDLQGGTGGTETVVATKGAAMPALESLPTRADFFFDGYFDAAVDGVKYYNADGSSAKAWDKSDATATLYAHWYDGVPEVTIGVECPSEEEKTTADYYLTHIYYALCTDWQPMTTTNAETGRKDLVYDNGSIVLMNKDSNLFKLCGDLQYIDWHWDDYYGKSAIIYDNIYVSESGKYDIMWYQRNGGKVDVVVNNDTLGSYNAGGTDTLTVYRAMLNAGEANTIKIAKNAGWPQSLGIMLQKSAAEVDSTVITLDMQGGAGGTETVVAKKGYDLPTITIPTRSGYFFEGYYTEAEGGDQYYNNDGTGFKAWDKSDKTYTLYAHWNDGGTGGECPDHATAISEDYFLHHMYDARCTELTNTWEKDNGSYIYTNAENERVKITASGEWLDFYWADPSSIIFDSIYVSADGYYDMTWFFRCDNIDGEATAGSKTQVWVNDELSGDMTVWISDPEVPLDETKYEGIELYADYPNKIKLLKVNGWPLTRGIQLSRMGEGTEQVAITPFFVTTEEGKICLHRLQGDSRICVYTMTGMQVMRTATAATSCELPVGQGAYVVSVNGRFAKAIVR